MGLWLVQECRRAGRRDGRRSRLRRAAALAEAAPADVPLFDPDDAVLLRPGDMPGRIADACAPPARPRPPDRGELLRSMLVSLACKYRLVLERSRSVAGPPDRRYPRDRRRGAKPAALPVDRGRHRPAGPRRPGRGDRARQRPRPGAGARRARRPGGDARLVRALGVARAATSRRGAAARPRTISGSWPSRAWTSPAAPARRRSHEPTYASLTAQLADAGHDVPPRARARRAWRSRRRPGATATPAPASPSSPSPAAPATCSSGSKTRPRSIG